LGRGRPKGSHNRKAFLAEELLDSHAEAVMSQALDLAEKGDVQVLLDTARPHPASTQRTAG